MPDAIRQRSKSALSPLELDAWRGMLRTHAELISRLDAELQRAHDLPLSSYDVLVQLEGAPDGRLRMTELAGAVLLTRSGLTRLVDRLVTAGLVERERCPTDARGLYAVLTDRGRARLREARPTHLRGVRAHFLSRLDDDDLHRLGGIWERVLADP